MNEFLKYLRQSFNNKRGKKPADECERILGLNGKVYDFATFYENHEDDIMILMAATLAKWETESSFTKEELEIYKLGLTEFPVFMAKCVAERDRKTQEEIAKINNSVD